MARIEGVPERWRSPLVKVTYVAARRTLRKMLGRPAPVMEPLALHAHRRWHMATYSLGELAIQRSRRLDLSLKELARARTGMLTGCPW
jgi:hypothetical protein